MKKTERELMVENIKRVREILKEGKDSKAASFTMAIHNNMKGVYEPVFFKKKTPDEVMNSGSAEMLVNSVNAVLKHKFKTSTPEDVELAKNFQKGVETLNKLIQAQMKKPSKAGVLKLGDTWGDIWNNYGSQISDWK